MPLRVLDASGRELQTAEEVRLPGWTEERYFEEAPEEGFYEFKDGELIVATPVSIEHQMIACFLDRLLGTFARHHRMGEVFQGPGVLRLREDLEREPDLFFVSERRRGQIREQWVDAPVEFVVEVTSPGSEARDLVEKREEYEAAGVEEYWVVDPKARRVVVHRRGERRFKTEDFTRGRVESEAVPGFWIEADWLWRRPLPSEVECLRALMGLDGPSS